MMVTFDLNSAQNKEQIIKFIQLGCLPEVPCNDDDSANYDGMFLAHLEIAKSVLNKLNNFLSELSINNVGLQIKTKDILNSCLYLCGEHSQSNLPWSDDESHSLMNLCVQKLCSLMHYVDTYELFINVNVSKFVAGLHYKLENEEWKKYPAAVECFMWILKSLKMPHLNTSLYLVMPLPLKLFDDYQVSNSIIALDAFKHIIENTPAVELAMSGHDVVLLKAFETRLRWTEYLLMPYLLRCFLSLISKMQMKHLNQKNHLEWTMYDDVMEILLPRMDMEHKNEAIKCYASILPFVLQSIGFSCIRWSERLIPLFEEYTNYSDSILATVKAMEVFIKQTWPRKCNDWKVILTILIKALYNEDKTSPQANKENILAIVECIKTLEAARPECVRDILNKLKARKEFESKKIFVESLELL